MKNKKKTDKELAQEQWNTFQAMPKRWLTDAQVNELYIKELKSRPQQASVFWPGLGNKLLPAQIQELQLELQSGVKTIFIPINNGSHWNFIALEKHSDSTNQWIIKKVETPGDGLCGKHTVTQSMQVLDEGLNTYAANNPNRVSDLSSNDPIYSQIQTALNKNTVKPQIQSISTTQGKEEDDFQIAQRESLKVKYISTFDYKLAKLAELEALGHSTETLCKELIQLLVDMAPHQRETAITRLELSNLAKKPSIAKIIEGCYQRLISNAEANGLSISINPHLLMPFPTPNYGKRPDIEEEESLILASNLAAVA